MEIGQQQGLFRRSKRNFSDLSRKPSRMGSIEAVVQQQKPMRPRLNSIKINHNKLPPDFFPKTQLIRRANKQSVDGQLMNGRQVRHKPLSQQGGFSPQKTSFFGFFDDKPKLPKDNPVNWKRQFQSREQPKRAKIFPQQRNLTPMTGLQRNEILNMFPASYDQIASEALMLAKKRRESQFSPRKQRNRMMIEQTKLNQPQDPEKNLNQCQKQFINMSTSGGSQDMHNITFFNLKSAHLPPINKGLNYYS